MRRALLAAAVLFLLAAPARAQPLVADLSSHLIAITTGFAGTEVLLFGATEGQGDVVVALRGPESEAVVRRKSRILGVWVNRDEVTFTGVPSFYRVAASDRIEDIAAPATRARHQLGVHYLRLGTREARPAAETAMFREGLLRNKERQGLFASEVGQVLFLGPRLFSTRFHLPSNVPTGAYTVEVFLIKDGQVIAAQTTPMFVSRVGAGAEVYEFAHRRAASYGIWAVLLAVASGWAAGALFRRA